MIAVSKQGFTFIYKRIARFDREGKEKQKRLHSFHMALQMMSFQKWGPQTDCRIMQATVTHLD